MNSCFPSSRLSTAAKALLFLFALMVSNRPGDAQAAMVVEGNGAVIANGDATPSAGDHTVFADTLVPSGTATQTFTIRNTGTGPLSLAGTPRVVIGGTSASDFRVTAQPSLSVPAGGSTTFTIRFDPSAPGARDATVSIASDDADPSPYQFSILGTGTRPTATVIRIERAIPSPTTLPEVVWQVTFSTPVSGFNRDNLTLTSRGVGGSPELQNPGTPSGGESAALWNIGVTTGTGVGTVDISFTNDTGLSHRIIGLPFEGERYAIDHEAPSLLAIRRQAPATATTDADALTFRVTFDEAMTGMGVDQLQVTGGTTAAVTSIETVAPDVYDLTVSGGDLDQYNGPVGLILTPNLNLNDIAGNPVFVGGPVTLESYTVTNTVQSDYVVTTSGTNITVMDVAGVTGTLSIEESNGAIRFASSSSTFRVNGGPLLLNDSGDLPLAGVTSVRVDAGAGNNAIWLAGAFSAMPDLIIDGGAGDDQFVVAQPVTFARDAGLTVNFQDDAAAPGFDSVVIQNTGNLAFSGSGSATFMTSGPFTSTAPSLRTENGAITVEANQQPVPSAGNFSGVILLGTLEATGSGQVSVRGRGGEMTTGNNVRGVWLYPTAQVIGGTTGEVLVEGRGGSSAVQSTASGVNLQGRITSNGAAVRVVGQGGGSGSANMMHGVEIAAGGVVSSGNGGAVSVNGTGGLSSGVSLRGVELYGTITSGGGAVSVVGEGGANSASSGLGVMVNGGGQISAGGVAPIRISGTGRGNTTSGIGVRVLEGGFISGNGGDISIDADSLITGTSHFSTAGQITNIGAGEISVSSDRTLIGGVIRATSVRLYPKTADLEIGLGGADSETSLGLIDAELDFVTAGTLFIGNNSTGPIRVSGINSPANAGSVVLTSNGAVTGSSGSNIVAPALSVRAASGAGTGTLTLLTQVPRISVVTATGTAFVRNSGNLEVGEVAGVSGVRVAGGSGTVSLVVTGSLRVAGPVTTAGSILLRATGANSDLIVEAGTDGVNASGGEIVAEAGRDVILGTTTSRGDVRSGLQTRITAGRDCVQDSGTLVGVVGTLSANVGRDFKLSSVVQTGSRFQTTGRSPVTITAANSISLDAGTLVEANNADVTLTSDLLVMPGAGTAMRVASGTALTTIRPSTAGRRVDLGGNAAASLALDDTMLDLVSAARLTIGSSTGGDVALSAPISRAARTNLVIASGKDILLASSINTGGGTLSLEPGASPGKVRLESGARLLTASSTSVKGTLAFAIQGPVAGTGHDQLRLAGSINLTGTRLELGGSYSPTSGSPIVLIDNDGTDAIFGSFTGVAEGAQVSVNGAALNLTYVGGDGNDVALVAGNTAPTDILLGNSNVDENAGANAVVGTLSAVDPDQGDVVSFSLAAGTGDADNARFSIAGSLLRLTASADFETKASYSVRIAARDGTGSSFSKAFTITVNDVNDRPVISTIVAQSTNEDTATGQIPFTISDEDAGAVLSLSATSGNTDLVAASGIAWGGSGANRQVVITPAANQSGSSLISITVSDGTLTATRDFLVTVNPVNDAPTLAAIANPETLPVDAGSQTIALSGISAGGGESQVIGISAVSSNPTLIPNPVVTYTSPSASGSLTFAPVAGRSGTAVITVIVSDDGGTANGGVAIFERSFTVEVTDETDLAVTLTNGTTTSVAGSTITYTLTASNAGPSPVSAASVVYDLPASITSATWTAKTAGGATAGVSGTGDLDEIVNLPVGASVTFTIEARIDPFATGTMAGTATISASPVDPVPGNNSASDVDTLTVERDLSVALSAPANIEAGEDYSYTLTVTNNGPSAAKDVGFSLPLPTGTTFVSLVSAGDWSLSTPASGATGTVGGERAVFAPGTSQITINVTAGFLENESVLTAVAGVSSSTLDPEAGNDTSTAETIIGATSEIAVYRVASPLPVPIADQQMASVDFGTTTAGNTLTENFKLENAGNGTLLVTTFAVPAGFSLVEPFSPQQIAPRGSITIAVRYDAAVVGTASGEVSIGSNDPDRSPFTFQIVATRNNLSPVAGPQSVTLDEDEVTNVLLTATDADRDTFGFSIVDQPQHGSLSGTPPEVIYTPDENFNGTDSFTFKANDGTADSAVVTVRIGIQPVNDPPIAAEQDLVIDEDDIRPIVLAATDVDGDPLSYVIVAQPRNGVLAGSPPNVTYTPDEDFNGTDSFTFKANDGTADSAVVTVSLVIDPVNDRPVAAGQNLVIEEDEITPIVLTATDVDGDTLSYAIVVQPRNGVLTGSPPNVIYTPDEDFNGTDSFTFKANDGKADSAVVTVSLVNDPVNDKPIAGGQNLRIEEDEIRPIILSATDADGDPLSYGIVTQPRNGSLSGNPPYVIYTPDENFNGTDSFTFKASDGMVDSEVVTVNLVIEAVNDPPIASGQNLLIEEDEITPIVLTATDADADPLSYIIVGQPQNGSLSGTPPEVIYTPDENFNGTDSFAFKANDGTADSAVVTVNLVIDPVNDRPIAAGQNRVIDEDAITPIALAATDTDGDLLSYAVVSQPQNGSLSGTPPEVIYTPNENFNGTDSFTFKANDGAADSAVATVNLVIDPVNDRPIAAGQYLVIDEDEIRPIILAATDADADLLSYVIVDQPRNGVLTGNPPRVIYTPGENFNGTDSFTFKVNDGTADSLVATIDIAIDPVNDAPVVTGQGIADLVQVRPDLYTTIDLSNHFEDAETPSDELEYSVEIGASTSGGPVSPPVQYQLSGSSLQITGRQADVVEITVKARDSDGLEVGDRFVLTIKQAPVTVGGGVPDILISPSESRFDIDLAAYFNDADGDALTFALAANSDPTVVAGEVNGSVLTLTPLAPGTAELVVSATDSDGNPVEHAFEVTIEDPVPDLSPTAGKPPVLNVQTGLYEISVTATNDAIFNIPGFRLRVTSALPEGMRLHNSTAAAGSNEPYLDVLETVLPGQSIVVVLEFYSPTRNYAGFEPTIIAEPLPEGIDSVGLGSGLAITRFAPLPDGSRVLEFISVPGAWYQIEYSEDLETWKKSLVPIQAGANRTQWIDRGPPYTDKHPSQVSRRFYRVSEIAVLSN